ncbi:MAG: hypothetical protein DDT19_01687 [Syntrophomonadaceae bacterium]|nr:hypothetical protein [Bacillota bacterium]
MTTINQRPFSSPRNINLKGQGTGRGGILLFEGRNAINPLTLTLNGLYVNASNQLVYSAQGTATTLGVVGYTTGAGGAVTQITSSSTGVTLHRLTGQITTVPLTTAAAAEEEFVVTNSTVAATDVVVASTTYVGTGTPAVSVRGTAAGSFVVSITNLHATAAFNAAVVINFAVIRGVAA